MNKEEKTHYKYGRIKHIDKSSEFEVLQSINTFRDVIATLHPDIVVEYGNPSRFLPDEVEAYCYEIYLPFFKNRLYLKVERKKVNTNLTHYVLELITQSDYISSNNLKLILKELLKIVSEGKKYQGDYKELSKGVLLNEPVDQFYLDITVN